MKCEHTKNIKLNQDNFYFKKKLLLFFKYIIIIINIGIIFIIII